MRLNFVVRHPWRTLALVCACIAVAGQRADAQTSTGSIRGFVRDSSGVAVAAVQIVARDVAQGTSRSTLSNDAGFYSLAGLRPGTYELSARRIGVEPVTREVTVGVGQTRTVDLSVAQTAAQLAGVLVTAPTETQAVGSEVATNVTQSQIRNLPSRDRNFLSIAQLAPGIRIQNPSTVFGGFQSGTQPAEQVNVFIDGASYKNDVLDGGVAGEDASQGNPFPQSAVQEFRVITQNYKAEYQKASSAIITAVTRSGTNQWQADGFLQGVVPGFAARDAFALTHDLDAPDYRRYQAGVSIGGPIQPDKLFFFGSYENNLRDQPSDILLGGDSAKFPQLANQLRSHTGRATARFREHLFFGKLTYVPTEKQTIEVSGNVRHETDFRGFGTAFNAPQNSAQTAEEFDNNVYTGLVSYKYAANRLLDEAQLNLQRTDWNPKPENFDVVGQNYFGLLRIGGRDSRQQFTQDRVGLRNDLTYSGTRWLGEHVFKGGVYVDFLRYRAEKFLDANPIFEYDPNVSATVPIDAQFGFGNPTIKDNNTQIGAYIQDDWNVTPKLLLNLGLRWDVETNMIPSDYVTPAPLRDSLEGPLSSKFLPQFFDLGGFSQYISTGNNRHPYLGAFQPRLGASYDLFGNQRTVLFGGLGVYFDRDIWNYMLDEQYRRQFSVLRINFNSTGPTASCPTCVQWDPSYLNPDALKQLAQSGQAGAPEVFLINNDTKPPKSYQFSAGIRQALGTRYRVTASYTGTRGYNGFAFVRATPPNALLPTYAQGFASTNEIRTWYDAFNLKLERPMGLEDWWGGSLAYTLAKGEQQGDYFFSLDDRYNRPKNYPKIAAANDQRHQIVADGMVRLPFDIRASTLITLGSGYPVIATDNSKGFGPDERTTFIYRLPKQSFIFHDAFAYRDVDFRLEKALPVVGGQSVSVTADLFNAFNFANYSCYNTFIPPVDNANPQPLSVRNPNFGTPGCAGPGRLVQLGVRYNFSQNAR